MRAIQHKAEAYWFYRVVSVGYDRWINPLFWTGPMRDRALTLARLDRRDLAVVDVGAGTGFTTEGIVASVEPRHVTMIDQSPHQLAHARAKLALAACTKELGDAEALPVASGSADRYVSAGSVEYWPDPPHALAEAWRVLRPGGIALVVGPLRRRNPLARALADAWMLFPPQERYVEWFRAAGFEDLELVHVAPAWWRAQWDPYAVAIAGRKPSNPAVRDAPLPSTERASEPMTPARFARFALGSLAGASFIPVALWFSALHRLRHLHPRSESLQ
jgi:MPBQ/MSBQ methyltransferase